MLKKIARKSSSSDQDVFVPSIITIQDQEVQFQNADGSETLQVPELDSISDIESQDIKAIEESMLPNEFREDLLAFCSSKQQALTPHRGPGRPRGTRNSSLTATPTNAPKTPHEMGDLQPPQQQQQQQQVLPPEQMQPQIPMNLIPQQQPVMPPVPQQMMMLIPPHSSRVPVVPAVSAVQQAARLREMFASTTPPPMPPCPWFDPSGIAPAEVEELKICFPNLRVCSPVDETDRDNVTYVTLRNTLIDVYRARPTERLTMAECRKHCDGDLAALVRLLSFLDRNRLINFALKVMAPANTTTSQNQQTNKITDELRNHWSRTPTCTACDRICLYTFYVLAPSVYGSALPLPQLKPCVWCSDCARDVPYSQCLQKISLPALHVSGGASSWSETQITLLFDAIENHGTDWIAIAKKVSTAPGNPVRTPTECLAAFLSMPLAEPANAMNVSLTQTKPKQVLSKNPPEDSIIGMEVLLTAIEIFANRLKSDESGELPKSVQNLAVEADKRLSDLKKSLEARHATMTES